MSPVSKSSVKSLDKKSKTLPVKTEIYNIDRKLDHRIFMVSSDPTIIVRLHSLLTGRDILYLSKTYDYQIKLESENVVSMILPDSLIEKLTTANLDVFTVTKYWYASKEVQLSDWTFSKTQLHLQKLINIANSHDGELRVFLQLDIEK